MPTLVLVISILREPNFMLHIDPMNSCAHVDKHEVERVTIVCRNHSWPCLLNMGEETPQQGYFVWLVKDNKWTFILIFRGVLEVLNIFADDLAICDQKTLSINHVGYHHNRVDLSVGKFERLLRRLNVKCHHDRICTLHTLWHSS